MVDPQLVKRARFVLDRVARNLEGQAEAHRRGGLQDVTNLRNAVLVAAAEIREVKRDLEDR